MGIWLYRDSVNDEGAVRATFASEYCIFCQNGLETLRADEPDLESSSSKRIEVMACPLCGWWKMIKSDVSRDSNSVQMWTSGAIGRLRDLDLHDDQEPLEEIRSYLAVRYERRFEVDPIVFERVVASVYGDLHYSPVVTGRSADGGLDIILRSEDERIIGVQVKRYRGSIKAEHIRALTGALFLKGFTSGIYVTTSRFQPGSSKAAALACARGIAVELVDGDRFFGDLGIAQRLAFKKIEEAEGPWHRAPLQRIDFAAWEDPPSDLPHMFP